MNRLVIFLTALFAGLGSLVAGAEGVQGQTTSGDADFRVYCASCHGTSGKGDGPLASSLKKRPADLTQLAKRNNGTFPADLVFRTVDGRNPVAGHGGGDMPVWGDVFAASRESQGPESVKARIETLVRYLSTIQQKP